MRIRRARALIVEFAGASIIIRNFMVHQHAPADLFILELLSRATDWQMPEALSALYPQVPTQAMEACLRSLTELGWLVVEHSEQAILDEEYESSWAWEATAGLYHFGIQNPPWLNPEESAQWMQEISVSKPPLPLLMTNEGLEHVMHMQRPDMDQGLFATFKRRRSIRSFEPDSVSTSVVRDCLFAGLGITGFLDTQMPGEEPRLPLKPTPSGGARNPFEGFVYAKNVDGLEPGIYHYSALDNSIGLWNPNLSVSTTELFAQQDWTEGAAFGILLVANFDRTMWKYPHPNAYRVVLMEAGHIGQNILLAAAEHDLAAAPTGAVSETAARELLGINRIRQSLVYAVFVGHSAAEAFEKKNFIPHPPN